MDKKTKNDDIKNKDEKQISGLEEKELANDNNEKNISNKIDDELSPDNDKKIANLESSLEEAKEEKLRLLAEMENLRKRFEKEKLDSIKFGNSNILREILSPCDNLLRALESLNKDEKKEEKNKELIDGLSMVYKEIISLLEKNGVKKIKALNNKFDHNLHQAMMEVESDQESGIVVKELQAGYTIHDRLLRPSMVGVSKKGGKN